METCLTCFLRNGPRYAWVAKLRMRIFQVTPIFRFLCMAHFQQHLFPIPFSSSFAVTMAKILVIANHNQLTPAIGVKYNNRIRPRMSCALVCKANDGSLTSFIYHHMFTMSNVMHMPLNRPLCHDPKKFLKGPRQQCRSVD
jgi:hypothetical protein